ncbi:MAG: histidine phosphatase family protein [Candidatus Promineifilaceae bacterium]
MSAAHWLLLVKHSLPEMAADRPASDWRLGTEGVRRCAWLAAALALYEPAQIVASCEPKAAETAVQVSRLLDVQWQTTMGLHEHERPRAGLLPQSEFERKVAQLFARPQERVFGAESGAEAGARFATAVAGCLAHSAGQNLIVVAHGTVITLLVAAHQPIEPFAFWRTLGLPSVVALRMPGYVLARTVNRPAAGLAA